MPNMGLVSLIKLKTGNLLTVLNNSPSSGEGKTSERLCVFPPLKCLGLRCFPGKRLNSRTSSLLQVTPRSFSFFNCLEMSWKGGSGGIPSLRRWWQGLLCPLSRLCSAHAQHPPGPTQTASSAHDPSRLSPVWLPRVCACRLFGVPVLANALH